MIWPKPLTKHCVIKYARFHLLVDDSDYRSQGRDQWGGGEIASDSKTREGEDGERKTKLGKRKRKEREKVNVKKREKEEKGKRKKKREEIREKRKERKKQLGLNFEGGH